MNVFTAPNSKNVISTLRIATIEKSELTFLLVLYFYVQRYPGTLYMETDILVIQDN